jgi:hypothetical protein
MVILFVSIKNKGGGKKGDDRNIEVGPWKTAWLATPSTHPNDELPANVCM